MLADRVMERKPLIQAGETFEFVPLSEAIKWTTDEFLERAHTILPLCECDTKDPFLMSQIAKNDAKSGLKRVGRHFQASTNNALCESADVLDRMDTCDHVNNRGAWRQEGCDRTVYIRERAELSLCKRRRPHWQ